MWDKYMYIVYEATVAPYTYTNPLYGVVFRNFFIIPKKNKRCEEKIVEK